MKSIFSQTCPNVAVDMPKLLLKCGVDHDIVEDGTDVIMAAAIGRMAMAIVMVKEVAASGYGDGGNSESI